MKKAVKTLALITISFLLALQSNSQINLKPFNALGKEIKMVISDYRFKFSSFTGDLIGQNTQYTEYKSKPQLEGAEECRIFKYSSKFNDVVSYEALMLTTEKFEKAKKEFKSLFNQVNNLQVSPGEDNCRLIGQYEEPAEEKKFTSVLFKQSRESETLKKFKVEIVMTYELTEWKVKLLIYDKEREDEERGKTVEEE